MHWYLDVIKKYADFSGRARRTEYWMFVLINAIIGLILLAIDHVLGLAPAISPGFATFFNIGLLSGIYTLALLLPSLAVQCRRLHDTDRSGWWILLSLIPIIGSIIVLVFVIQPGSPGSNRFGPDPKGAPDPSPSAQS